MVTERFFQSLPVFLWHSDKCHRWTRCNYTELMLLLWLSETSKTIYCCWCYTDVSTVCVLRISETHRWWVSTPVHTLVIHQSQLAVVYDVFIQRQSTWAISTDYMHHKNTTRYNPVSVLRGMAWQGSPLISPSIYKHSGKHNTCWTLKCFAFLHSVNGIMNTVWLQKPAWNRVKMR